MKSKVSLLIIAALLLSFSASAFAVDEYIFDKNGYLQEIGILNDTAAEVFEETGNIVSLCIGASEPGMSVNEQAQRLFEEKFGQSEGIMLLDCIDSKNCSIYFSKGLRETLTEQEAAELFEAYDSQSDYDSAVSEYISCAKNLLKKISAKSGNESAESAPVIPEERQLARVVDVAGVIPAGQLQELNELADSISEQYQCDVAVVFVDTTNGKDVQAYTDDYYDFNGYGYGEADDGALLLVAVKDREYAISTFGIGINALNDNNLIYLIDRFTGKLTNGDWAGAAKEFITGSSECLYYARYQPDVYSSSSISNGINPLKLIPINFVVGFLIGLIPVAAMKGKHKSVRKCYEASNYLREGSFRLTYENNRLINTSVNRVKRPEVENRSGGGGGHSSTHISSSGRSHGGSSGRF